MVIESELSFQHAPTPRGGPPDVERFLLLQRLLPAIGNVRGQPGTCSRVLEELPDIAGIVVGRAQRRVRALPGGAAAAGACRQWKRWSEGGYGSRDHPLRDP